MDHNPADQSEEETPDTSRSVAAESGTATDMVFTLITHACYERTCEGSPRVSSDLVASSFPEFVRLASPPSVAYAQGAY